MATRDGLKAVDMFEAIERGTIKALWVMATNPAVSLPRAGAIRAALKKLELFVVSETTLRNDTVEAGAHVLLPAAAWGEKDGTVTNSERRISRQRAFLPLPGEAQPDWWIVSEVARRLGFERAFGYRTPAEVFREHAALSAFENTVSATSTWVVSLISPTRTIDRLEPVMWPVRAAGEPGETRFFGAGKFFTDDRRARFIAAEHPRLRLVTSEAFPLRLNTGRLRDQWHTMTRTGKSPRLSAHAPEPLVDIHPDDAPELASPTAVSPRSRPRTAAPCFGFASNPVSNADRFSLRSTGATRLRPIRASAPWRWRKTTRFPASPSSRPRLRASNRSRLPIAALR